MKTLELKIPNMKCMGCVNTVQTTLSKLLGVLDVEAYLDTKTVTIKFNGSSGVQTQIYKTLESIGFPAEK
jgi:copper chaperone CopZ